MSTAYQPMDFSESKALARTSAESSGLTLLKEKKHVTLGWHMTGNGHAGLSHIFEATLGKYRDSLKGVPVAIGPIKPKGSVAYIIDDHSCMHLDVTATFVVFVPKIGATYQAEVTKVDPTTVTAKMYDIITIIAKRADKRVKYPIGHMVSVKIEKIVISRNMCQLRGKIVGAAQEPSEAMIKKRKRRSALENVFSSRKNTSAAANHVKFEQEDDQEVQEVPEDQEDQEAQEVPEDQEDREEREGSIES